MSEHSTTTSCKNSKEDQQVINTHCENLKTYITNNDDHRLTLSHKDF